MSLLFGDSTNKEFNARFKNYALNINSNRNQFVWMQAFPNGWDNLLADLFGEGLIKSKDNTNGIEKNIIELNTRVNFKFNLNIYMDFKKILIKMM